MSQTKTEKQKEHSRMETIALFFMACLCNLFTLTRRREGNDSATKSSTFFVVIDHNFFPSRPALRNFPSILIALLSSLQRLFLRSALLFLSQLPSMVTWPNRKAHDERVLPFLVA